MRPRARLSAVLLAVTALLPAAAASEAGELGASEAAAEASLTCRPERAPGRVLCELSVSPRAGQRLRWVDALVVSAPPFVAPLRSRVSRGRFEPNGEGALLLPLAFVAATLGEGEVRVEARAVACPDASGRRCRPVRLMTRAVVRVG